jgi:hypothetical protein
MPTVLITGLTGFVSLAPSLRLHDHYCRSIPDSLRMDRGKQSDYNFRTESIDCPAHGRPFPLRRV